MKVTVIPLVIGTLCTVTKRIGTMTGGLGNKRTIRDHPNFSTIKIGQNTGMNPGDLRRLSVPQTPPRTHRLTLVRKKSQNNNNNISLSAGTVEYTNSTSAEG